MKLRFKVQQDDNPTSPLLRPNTQHRLCLCCGQHAKHVGRKRDFDVFRVRTSSFKVNIENICNERHDQWVSEVGSRLEVVNDLPAADAVLHQLCSVNFRAGKQVP